jgi:hypothetical protein
VLNPPNRRIEFHELNDDGIVDILARPDGTSILELWLGNGAGDFVPGMVQDFPGSIATQGRKGRTPAWFGTLSRTFSDFGCTDAWPSAIQIDPAGQLVDLRTGPTAKYDRILDVVDVDGNALPDLFLRACEDPPGASFGAELLMSYPEGFMTVASAANAGVVEAADLDGNLEVDLVWSDATDGTLVTQFVVGGVPGPITYGAAIPAGTRAAGHGSLFGDGFAQVVATVADDTGGLTVLLISGTPC